MAERRFRAAGPARMRSVALDDFTAIYHRPSGLTQLLASPAPEILALLDEDALTRTEIAARLRDAYEMPDFSDAALGERIDELLMSGLVEAA